MLECVGRKCSKPLVCICTMLQLCICHTATHTHAHIWRSWSNKVSLPQGECFLGLGFARHTPALCSTHCSNVILPNPRTLIEYTPHQYWSDNFIKPLSGIADLWSYIALALGMANLWSHIALAWEFTFTVIIIIITKFLQNSVSSPL